jgi:hypothetical protein
MGGSRAQKHKAPFGLHCLPMECLPVFMTVKASELKIVHTGASHACVCEHKAAWLNQIKADAHTRRKTQERSCILWDFRLIKSKAQHKCITQQKRKNTSKGTAKVQGIINDVRNDKYSNTLIK